MKFIGWAPLLSTQSALGDVAEVEDAVGFADKRPARANDPNENECLRLALRGPLCEAQRSLL
jgi:hypothetical protein